jgi:Kef-type K+ transport system membrane component KefB
MAISALPVLARILVERRLLATNLGVRCWWGCILGTLGLFIYPHTPTRLSNSSLSRQSVVMSTAAVDDVVAWILLAIVVALVNSGKSLNILYLAIFALCDGLVLFFIIRPILAKLGAGITRKGVLKPSRFLAVLFVTMISAYACEIFGFSALFGA